MGLWKLIEKGFKKITKPIVKAVDLISGRTERRQKSLYNEATRNYESYASEAQNYIDSLSRSLEANRQSLRQFEEQRNLQQYRGYNLQGSIGQYEQSLERLAKQKETAESEASGLQAAFEGFKSKAPELAGKIAEVEQLPGNFQKLYDSVLQQRSKLKGLSEEEAAPFIKKYKAEVGNLRKQREEVEGRIRKSMDEITAQHHGLSEEKRTLEQRLQSYNLNQQRLLSETSIFETHKTGLQKMINDYKAEQDKLNAEYNSKLNLVRSQEKQLGDYVKSAQTKLDELGDYVGWRGKKLKRDSTYTGIARGVALGAATLGAGMYLTPAAAATGTAAGAAPALTTGAKVAGYLATALKSAAPAIGLGGYLSGLSNAQKVLPLERLNLNELTQGRNSLNEIANLALGGPKIEIPELGGLKQSLSHFGMPSVPKLQDLPRLDQALGKIASLKDIEALGLGLPSMVAASGRKYSHQVLYNPDFIKKLRRVSKFAGRPYGGHPYFQPINAANNNLARGIHAY